MPPPTLRRQQHVSFHEDDFDQQAFEFADLAARAILDILQVPTGTPHLTERYQRVTHEVFAAIRSTVDMMTTTPLRLPPTHRLRESKGVHHYRLLRRD